MTAILQNSKMQLAALSAEPRMVDMWFEEVYARDTTQEMMKDISAQPGLESQLGVKFHEMMKAIMAGHIHRGDAFMLNIARTILLEFEAARETGHILKGRELAWRVQQFYNTRPGVSECFGFFDIVKITA